MGAASLPPVEDCTADSLADDLASLDISAAAGPVQRRAAIDLCSSSSDSDPGSDRPSSRPACSIQAPAPIRTLSSTAEPAPLSTSSEPAGLVLGDEQQYKLAASISGRLYAHQLEGVRWLWNLERGGILADDMGLGKVSLSM